MREMLTRTIGSTIEVRLDLSADLWPALIDPTQIETAILNLAINARDAMPSGGTLTIETRNLPAGVGAPAKGVPAGACRPRLRRPERARHRHRNAGRGAALGRRAVLHDQGAGQGLGAGPQPGLRHGAAVERRDGDRKPGRRRDRGAPVSAARAAPVPPALEPARAPAAAEADGGRVLVADDDPGVREITAQMLRQCGFAVAEAASGQAALDALEQRSRVYELVVIDIAMPGLSGVETVARARRRWPGLRVLYMTGYADAADTDPDTGGDTLLKKPFRLHELRGAVRDALERRPRRRDRAPTWSPACERAPAAEAAPTAR